MNGKHWGEIPKISTNQSLDLTDDIKQAMDKFNLLENANEDLKPVLSSPIILQPQDPLVVYAISLHKYINDLTEIIRLAELDIENNVLPSEDAVSPIPPLPDIALKHKMNCLNFIHKEDTDFTSGKPVEIPELTGEIINKSLRKSICTLFAHLGFESTHESVLNILVDVLKEFYQIFCKKLELSLYYETTHKSSGFPNVIERVLVELGMGGIKGIHDYYQARIIKYVNVLHKRCENLKNRYDNLMVSRNPSQEIENVNVKIEKEEIDENPEVHLSDGEIEFSSLETGFQLLNSLEAETSLQNFVETDVDMLQT